MKIIEKYILKIMMFSVFNGTCNTSVNFHNLNIVNINININIVKIIFINILRKPFSNPHLTTKTKQYHYVYRSGILSCKFINSV